MNILVLNGSPRQNGNTAKMVTAFCEGAESSRHTVKTVNVCKLNVKGCLACEYCHSKGNGKCIQKDDMQDIYLLLNDTNMLILASPIYYPQMRDRQVLFCALSCCAEELDSNCNVFILR